MHTSPLLTLFIQISLILGLSRIIGLFVARLHQPQVMGEMVAGILLGPSCFGLLAPHAAAWVFPADSIRYLDVLSQVGVVFFLFLVGLDFDPKLIRNRGRIALVVSSSSIITPFVLGTAMAIGLYACTDIFRDPKHAHYLATILFMGAAVSVTAFPVLARILTERNLHKSAVGSLAITCAAANDVLAWCLLAFVVAIARFEREHAGMGVAFWTAGMATLYIGVMFLLVKPLMHRLELIYDRQGRLSQNVVSVIFLLILASSYTTQLIGIHALFGAFIMGTIMPKGTRFVRHLSEKLEDYTVVFLLPIFFAYTGLQTHLGLLNGAGPWLIAGIIIAVACLGKFGGSAFAARACGLPWRESSALGVLMNARGLMELIILNIALDLHVISDAVFAMMVIMALTTTAMTTPVLAWVYPARLMEEEKARRAKSAREPYAILIPVSLPKSGGPLVQLADLLMGDKEDRGTLFALHLRRPVDHAPYRTGLDEAEITRDEAIAPLLAQARARGMPVEPLSFMSRDIAGDIGTIAKAKHVNLVLMGFHKPVIGKTILGGTVHRVLAGCETDVAIFVDRGFRQARRILVPYLGSQHDRLALEMAARMARNAEARVTVLHVVPPMRNTDAQTLHARGTVERIFTDPTQPAPVTFHVIEDPSPVGVVLHQAQQFDLVVIGVAEEWGLESHLFGWRPERIARDCPSSLLIVRKFGGSNAAKAVETVEQLQPLTTESPVTLPSPETAPPP